MESTCSWLPSVTFLFPWMRLTFKQEIKALSLFLYGHSLAMTSRYGESPKRLIADSCTYITFFVCVFCFVFFRTTAFHSQIFQHYLSVMHTVSIELATVSYLVHRKWNSRFQSPGWFLIINQRFSVFNGLFPLLLAFLNCFIKLYRLIVIRDRIRNCKVSFSRIPWQA